MADVNAATEAITNAAEDVVALGGVVEVELAVLDEVIQALRDSAANSSAVPAADAQAAADKIETAVNDVRAKLAADPNNPAPPADGAPPE